MRSIERDILLCMLAACAGSADGWSYFGLGHAFVANMTGNTVLLGMSVFATHDALHPLISLSCYSAGVITGSLLTRNVQPISGDSPWPRQVSRTLLLEAVLLLCAEMAWFASHPSGSPHPSHVLLLGCVALAIGLQSAAMVQLKIPGIVTTYITGTWTTLMNGLTRVRTAPPAKKHEFETRLGMQAAVLAVYFFAAVVAGGLFRYIPTLVGALPALSVLLVALYTEMQPLDRK
ncbi:MAG: DUF1275 domain-containing protein [Silvibacterium sp.]|nr:DUF1275 domain-containing protein [Silvibacterium sp.]